MHTDQVPRTTSLEALRSDVRNYPVCRTSPLQSTEEKLQTISTEQKDSFCATRSRIAQIPLSWPNGDLSLCRHPSLI